MNAAWRPPMRAAKVLTATGAATALAARGRSRLLSIAAGATLVAASAVTRFGVFHAGRASARDPKYTIVPQRTRIDARERPPGSLSLAREETR